MVQDALQAAGLATLEPQPELALEDGYRNVTFDDSYHWVSGTRMAASAAEGVVDTDLKLHGVSNAYVCSASVYPTSGFANPVHTMLALAMRLADHLVAGSSASDLPAAVSTVAASHADSQVQVDA
jgi:choline dehydrogenase-like flavoprotein